MVEHLPSKGKGLPRSYIQPLYHRKRKKEKKRRKKEGWKEKKKEKEVSILQRVTTANNGKY
jgi:Zn-finger nucleic acid-binding protein